MCLVKKVTFFTTIIPRHSLDRFFFFIRYIAIGFFVNSFFCVNL